MEQLRKAMEDSGMTRYAISQATGISQAVLSRFARGVHELSGPHIDTLCAHLGLELRPVRRKRSPAKKKSRTPKE